MMCDMSREMNVEENRLETFSNWPANDAARLAKAGFYYTGRGREVQCFFCGTKISDWTSDDQLSVCHQLSCLFAVNPASTCNVPLAPAANNNVIPESASPSSQSSDASRNITEVFRRPLNPRKEYGTVQQRLESFANWPIPSVVLPEQLASAGFYYLRYKDMVECAFCGGVLMNWEPNQDPDMSHRSCFPNCDFYMNREQDADVLELVTILPGTTENITDLGIQRHMAPVNPKYAVYEKRLQTFTEWPKDLTQTPEMLAAAGFYYTGCKDQVRCFHCDGGLRDWEPTDDVWVEHARWFAKCGFVNLMRGQKFVKQCVDNRKPLDLSIFTNVPEDDVGETSVASPSTTAQANNPMTDTARSEHDVEVSVPSLSAAMQDPLTDTARSVEDVTGTSVASLAVLATNELSKSAIKAIFERLLEDTNPDPDMAETEIELHIALFKRVKKALKNRLETIGESYANIDQLVQDVLRDQIVEDLSRLDTNRPNSPTSELINLLKQCTIQTTISAANQLNTQESSNVAKTEFEKKDTDNKSDDIMSLREENRKLKEAHLCKVCMDHELALVFLPCGHLTTCDLCGPALTNCPLCRLEIRAYVRTYLS